MLAEVKKIATAARLRKPFSPTTVVLDATTAALFVALRTDPKRFTPKIFEDSWAIEGQVARADEMKLLAAVLCPDEVVRIMGRQDGRLFAMTDSKSRRRR